MTNPELKHDTAHTIASENDDLRHDEHSSDIRGGDGHEAPEHGPDTIAIANRELRKDEKSDENPEKPEVD